MKIVIQRVQSASVAIEDSTVGTIKQGLLLLVGVGPEDTKEDLDYAVRKIINMRIFSLLRILVVRFYRFLSLRFLQIRKKGIDRHLRELQSLTWPASSMTISTNPCQVMFL